MRNLSPDALALIEAARQSQRIPEDRLARVRASLPARVAGAGAASAAAMGAKLGIVVVACVVAAVAFMQPGPNARTPVGRVVAAPAPPAPTSATASPDRLVSRSVAPSTERVAPSPTAEPDASTVVRSTTSRRSATSRASEASLSEELALMRTVHDALRAGAYAEALAGVEAHRRRFPAGRLRQEREGARWIAVCHLMRSARGSPEIAAFLEAFGSSPIALRVRAACLPEAPGAKVDSVTDRPR